MLEQLLVPLDGSGFGEETLPWASRLARCTGAEVAVAHVHVPHVPDHLISNTQYQYEGVDLGEYDEHDQEDEMAYLQSVSNRISGSLGRPVESVLLQESSVVEGIENLIRKKGTDLIVMSTHGRTGLSRAWLGSVAESLVRESPCPVLLVRPSGGEVAEDVALRHILVPLDGSETSDRVLPHVVELAVDTSASVTLLRVVPSAVHVGTRVVPVPRPGIDRALGVARRHLDDRAGELRRRGVSADVRLIEHAHPARAILDTVEETLPDLVMMATHGYQGVKRYVLGSVADKVLRGSEVPLLLLGPGA